MKFTIYEDPITHLFAHLPLPSRFLDGDTLPRVTTDRWFETRDAAIAALSELLDRDDAEAASASDLSTNTYTSTGALLKVDPARRPSVWFVH
jgi:hypothetical protein